MQTVKLIQSILYMNETEKQGTFLFFEEKTLKPTFGNVTHIDGTLEIAKFYLYSYTPLIWIGKEQTADVTLTIQNEGEEAHQIWLYRIKLD